MDKGRSIVHEVGENMEEMTLQKYLMGRRKEFSRLEEEISFLESIKSPVIVHLYYNGFKLLSSDYSMATGFNIAKRDSLRNCSSDYDGGIDTLRYDFYPQFYFILKRNSKNFPVRIQHEGFDKDNDIVIRSCDVTTGTGEYYKESRNEERYIDVNRAISFFKNRGVEKTLLDRLQKKIEKRHTWVIK